MLEIPSAYSSTTDQRHILDLNGLCVVIELNLIVALDSIYFSLGSQIRLFFEAKTVFLLILCRTRNTLFVYNFHNCAKPVTEIVNGNAV